MFFTPSDDAGETGKRVIFPESGRDQDYYGVLKARSIPCVPVDLDTQILLSVWNSQANVTKVRCRIRMMNQTGDIEESSYDIVPNTDRSVKTITINCGRGYVIGASLVAIGTAPRRGETYCKLEVFDVPDNTQVQTLIGEYLDGTSFISYPQTPVRSSLYGAGILKSVTGIDPAAGAEISDTVPTNARWKIRGMRVTFVTDANVANRTVLVGFDDGTTNFLQVQDRTVITATQSRGLDFSVFAVLPADTANDHFFVLPYDMFMAQGYRIRTNTANLQVGDNYGAVIYIVEEWIEE